MLHKVALIILFYAFLSVTNGLKCYNCDPKQYQNNECETNPSITTQEDCKEPDSVCISAYLGGRGLENGNGIYRGCFKGRNQSVDGCTAYREEFKINKGINLVSCSSCKTDLCNFDTNLRSAPLNCYNCDVENDKERCKSPSEAELKPMEEKCERNDGSADNFVCISSYLKHKSDPQKSGPYRGCFGEVNVAQGCDNYQKTLTDFESLECTSCTDRLCNEHKLIGDRLVCHSCGSGKTFEECSEITSSMDSVTCEGDANEYACVSAYLKPTKGSKERSNIYRTCVLNENPCESFKSGNTNADLEVSFCYSCNEKFCNNETYRSEDDNSATANYISINLLFMFILINKIM